MGQFNFVENTSKGLLTGYGTIDTTLIIDFDFSHLKIYHN